MQCYWYTRLLCFRAISIQGIAVYISIHKAPQMPCFSEVHGKQLSVDCLLNLVCRVCYRLLSVRYTRMPEKQLKMEYLCNETEESQM